MVTAPVNVSSRQLRVTADPYFVGGEVPWLEKQDNAKVDCFLNSEVDCFFHCGSTDRGAGL